MASIDDILAKARPPETEIRVCLRGDLVLEYDRLTRELNDLDDDGSLAGPSARQREIAERMQAIQEEMADSTVAFKFRGLPRAEYSKLLEKHPPRKDKDEVDVNWSTFPAALIQASCVDPVLGDGDIDKLAAVVTDAQWNDLYAGAHAVNRLRVDVPKSQRVSEILAANVASNSRPPGPGEFPAAASSAGSLAG